MTYKNILHLSHTDIRYDARIIKEMYAISNEFGDSEIQGIGIELDEKNKISNLANELDIVSLNLKSKKIKFLPKVIRHLLTLSEFFIKTITCKKRNKKIEVIHCHDTVALPVALFLKFLCKCKLIYDAHELESDRAGISKLMGKMVYLFEKYAWKKIDSFITVSPEILSWYVQNFGNKKSEVILNSPFSKDFKLEKNKSSYLRDYFSIPSSNPIYLYVGFFTSGRGINTLIEIFKKEQSRSIVFLGYGNLYQTLKNAEQEFENIHVHDAVMPEKVLEVSSSADFGLCLLENVSLSDYLSLPNKLFEYTFGNLLVLCSDFPAIRNFVYKYKCGLVCKNVNDIPSYLKTIENLRTNDHLNFNCLHEDCSWEAQEKKIIGLYNCLLR